MQNITIDCQRMRFIDWNWNYRNLRRFLYTRRLNKNLGSEEHFSLGDDEDMSAVRKLKLSSPFCSCWFARTQSDTSHPDDGSCVCPARRYRPSSSSTLLDVNGRQRGRRTSQSYGGPCTWILMRPTWVYIWA